jgi:hypothetical protein
MLVEKLMISGVITVPRIVITTISSMRVNPSLRRRRRTSHRWREDDRIATSTHRHRGGAALAR